MKALKFLCVLLIASGLKAQDAVSEIKNLMQVQEQSWNRGDIPGFMEYYWKNDSLKFIGSSGITYGWKNTIERYEKAYPGKEAMGELKFTIIEATKLAKDAVYVIGKWELRKEKPAGGYFTLLWRKLDKKWVIVSDHTS
jgi:ketosteroid isomerase-like protein